MTLFLLNNNLYEINNALVDVYDITTGQNILQQNNLSDIFKLPETSIDAALNWGDGKIYFFKGDNYYKYDVAANKCDDGYPLKIAANWNGLWSENIWACFRKEDKAYFFAGEDYDRYDCTADKTDADYPMKITEQWHGLPLSITGAVMLNSKYVLIQNDSDYYLYDWDADNVVNNKSYYLTDALALYISNSSGSSTGNQPSQNNQQQSNNASANTIIVNADWQTILTDTNSTADDIQNCIASIRQTRDAVTTYVKPTNGGYFYFGKSNTRPSTIASGSVEDWIWEEIKSEGSFDSINAYDNMIVTWGKGIAKGNILKIMQPLFTANVNLKNTFYNVGIAIAADGTLQIVNTTTNKIITGDDALKLMKVDTKLLDFLADVAQSSIYQTEIATTQWDFVMNVNSNFIQYAKTNNWGKDAVQLTFHLNWWLPAYGWNGNTQAYKNTNGDPTKIIITFKQKQVLYKDDLIKKLKILAGNAFLKYIGLQKYTTVLADSDCEKFIDGTTTYYVPTT